MFRPTKAKIVLFLLVGGAVVSLAVGLTLSAEAAGVALTPWLIPLICCFGGGAVGWALYARERGRLQASKLQLAGLREAGAATAWRDAISGLASYKLFDAALQSAFARAQRYGRPFSLLLIEVGAAGGARFDVQGGRQDRLLHYLGTIIIRNTRSADTAARLSESMFGIVLPETEVEGARALWERLRQVASTNWAEERFWALSGGTAGYNVDVSSIESLMGDADRRLALEKRRLRAEPEP